MAMRALGPGGRQGPQVVETKTQIPTPTLNIDFNLRGDIEV